MHHLPERDDHGGLFQPARHPGVQPALLLQCSMRADPVIETVIKTLMSLMRSRAVRHDQAASHARYIARSASEKQQKMTCRTAGTEARQAWTVPMAIRAAASRG